MFHQLFWKECRSGAERDYLSRFRRSDALPPPNDEVVYRSLHQRQLVVETDGGQWRLRVPLMLRWLRERG